MLTALLAAFAVTTLPYASSQVCNGGVMNQTYVDSILKRINGNRTALVKGEQNNGQTGTKLPKGKNMNKMEWSCDLELAAIQAVNGQCVTMKPNTPSGNTGFFASYDDPDYYDTLTMVDIWLIEINGHSFSNSSIGADSVKYENTQLSNYANLVRSTTTLFGCVEMKCTSTNKFTSYCLTNQSPLATNDVVYEVGNGGCTQNSDCTGGATCETSSGLCIPSNTTTTPTAGTSTTSTATPIATTTTAGGGVLPTPGAGENTRCPQNSGMTDSLRTQFLSMHNFRRSELAKGNIAKKNGNFMPKAGDMQRMRYNCAMESAAAQFVRSCPTATSSESSRPGMGENFFRISQSGLADYTNAVRKAVTSWWKVVRQEQGIGMMVTFRQHHLSNPIVSFTQMGWAQTRKLGCAIARCSSDYVVVCRYNPRGNQVGQVVYTRGEPCTACPSGAWCTDGSLCTLP